MNFKGYIKVYREIEDHWLWADKPFSKGQAWIDLVMCANGQPKKVNFGSKLIDVPRGSFITSELKLMNRWGWSKTKLRAFLLLLENEHMIIKQKDHKKTTLTICKYNTFQSFQYQKKTTEKLLKDRKKTIEKHN